MYKEYAVDPKILNSYERLKNILGSCGWHEGKVVCATPSRKKWISQIYNSCQQNNIVFGKELDKIATYLAEYKQKSNKQFCIRKPATQDQQVKPWLDSVREENARLPYTAIFSDQDINEENIIDWGLMECNDTRWQKPSGISRRLADEYAKIVALLSQNSSRIVFVDPYFDFTDERYTRSFWEMLKTISTERYERHYESSNPENKLIIELHMKAVKNNTEANDKTVNTVKHNMIEMLPKWIPAGMPVEVMLWQEQKDQAERLHNRYFLTNLGGLSFGIGLDTPSKHGDEKIQNDDIFILTKEQHQKRYNQYRKDSVDFELLANFTLEGIKNER